MATNSMWFLGCDIIYAAKQTKQNFLIQLKVNPVNTLTQNVWLV